MNLCMKIGVPRLEKKLMRYVMLLYDGDVNKVIQCALFHILGW